MDAALALQTCILAAETLGLGTCPISVLRNRIAEVARILELPDKVFPVAGLCLGYPAQQGFISMRLPPEATVHIDRYDDSGLAETVDAYDRRRDARHSIKDRQRDPERFGTAEFYGWSEDKARQAATPEGAGSRPGSKRTALPSTSRDSDSQSVSEALAALSGRGTVCRFLNRSDREWPILKTIPPMGPPLDGGRGSRNWRNARRIWNASSWIIEALEQAGQHADARRTRELLAEATELDRVHPNEVAGRAAAGWDATGYRLPATGCFAATGCRLRASLGYYGLGYRLLTTH